MKQWEQGWRCRACGLRREEDFGPDPCWGKLPGVNAACCGHGSDGYVLFENGKLIRFIELYEIEQHNGAPVYKKYERFIREPAAPVKRRKG